MSGELSVRRQHAEVEIVCLQQVGIDVFEGGGEPSFVSGVGFEFHVSAGVDAAVEGISSST